MGLIIFSILFYVLVGFKANAAEFQVIKYNAQKGESLKTIFLLFLKKDLVPARANPSIALTLKKNNHIKKWNPLKENVVFDLFIDGTILDTNKLKDFLSKNNVQTNHHLSLFSMPSIGFFSQSNSSGFSVKYNQISFLSLGLSYSYSPAYSFWSYQCSAYYSSIAAASNQINGVGGSVDIPAEYGANIYVNYNLKNTQTQFYTGLDLENFSSFNLESIVTNGDVGIDNHNIYYVTLGSTIKLKNLEGMSVKASLSKSVVSTYQSSVNSNQKLEISGFKFMTMFSYQISEKWSTHLLFKSHSLSGDNKLQINRFGIGMQYLLF